MFANVILSSLKTGDSARLYIWIHPRRKPPVRGKVILSIWYSVGFSFFVAGGGISRRFGSIFFGVHVCDSRRFSSTFSGLQS